MSPFFSLPFKNGMYKFSLLLHQQDVAHSFLFHSENATNAWVAAEETETEKPAPKLTITKEVTPQPSSSSSDSQGNQDGESSASRLLTGLSLGAASAVLGSALLF